MFTLIEDPPPPANDAEVRTALGNPPFDHIDAQAQSAALALGPEITTLNDAELATNAAENFDADRPWQNYKQRLPAGR